MRTAHRILGIAFVSALLVSCGGPKPPPETGPGKQQQGEAVPAAPVKPKREVSREATTDFDGAIKRYEEARKSGGISKANCADLAQAFADVYQSHPKLAEAKFNEGVVWEECGDLGRAEQTYQTLLGQHPKFGPALNNLGNIAFLRGQTSQALSFFNQAAAVKNSEGYANVAMIQRNQSSATDSGAIKEAVNNVHRALAVDSFNIEAYATLALLLYDYAKTEAQLEIARLICVQATKVDDKYAPIYNLLGLILLKQRKVTPALAEFKKAAALDKNFKEAHMNIGAITLSFRDYKTAEDSFRAVLALNPSKGAKIEALTGLGVALRGQRKFKEAMQQYEEALKLDPSNVDIVFNQGILVQDYMFDAGNPQKAIQDLQTAANYLEQYVSRGKKEKKIAEAKRRLKNIHDLIPMLQENLKMSKQM